MMNENTIEQKIEDENSEPITLYSQRAISIATYFGGPLATGILLRQNYKNLGKEKIGKNLFIIGIISTFLLLILLFSIPEDILNKIPNPAIPLFYMAIIYFLIDIYHGQALKEHKNLNRPFYSAWKAAGIGFICMLIYLVLVFGYVFLKPDNFDSNKYNQGIATYNKNEEEALQLFTLLENGTNENAVDFISNRGLPAWSKNLKIIEELDAMEGVYDNLKKQNKLLKQYTILRIQTYELIKLALSEQTNSYDSKIDSLNKEIDQILTKLEEK